MPQLNPTPWFSIMLLVWANVFITALLLHNFAPTPQPTTNAGRRAPHWEWTWP
uniref:ATP synthase complex subunit 8 n=1 Tax=Paroedura masobe TaxID=347812 RepID=A0A7R7G1R3_9SAUR|nr:ATPase subunit 8 [Paroedura masobe]